MLWWGVYRTQMLSCRHEGVPGWLPTRWVSVKAHSRSLGAPKARQVLKRKLDRYLDGTQTRGNTPFFSPGTSLLFLPIFAPSFPFPSPYSPFLSYFSLLPFFPISLSSLSFPSPSPPFLPIPSLPFPSRSPPPFSSWSGDLLEAPHPLLSPPSPHHAPPRPWIGYLFLSLANNLLKPVFPRGSLSPDLMTKLLSRREQIAIIKRKWIKE